MKSSLSDRYMGTRFGREIRKKGPLGSVFRMLDTAAMRGWFAYSSVGGWVTGMMSVCK